VDKSTAVAGEVCIAPAAVGNAPAVGNSVAAAAAVAAGALALDA